MTDLNGRKPPPDPAWLTPNDWRRLRKSLAPQRPDDLIQNAELEDMHQLLILAYKLREDPSFTWDQAGDIPPRMVLDFSGGLDGQSPPDLQEPPNTGSGGSPASSTAPRSRKKATASDAARSSAATSA